MKMLRRLTLALLTLATWGAATASQAGTGLMELPGLLGDGPITVFYPSSSADEPVQRGPFQLPLAWQGSPVRGNGLIKKTYQECRLVGIRRGDGGRLFVLTCGRDAFFCRLRGLLGLEGIGDEITRNVRTDARGQNSRHK